MSQELWVTAGISGVVAGFVFFSRFYGPLVSSVGAIVLGIGVVVFYLYSPAPTRTPGMGSSVGEGYWGFTPREEE